MSTVLSRFTSSGLKIGRPVASIVKTMVMLNMCLVVCIMASPNIIAVYRESLVMTCLPAGMTKDFVCINTTHRLNVKKKLPAILNKERGRINFLK